MAARTVWLILILWTISLINGKNEEDMIPDLTDDEMYDLWVETDEKGYDLVKCKFNMHFALYIEVRYDWAPLGAERFMELVRDKHFHGAALFRGLSDFIVQFGLASSQRQRRKWGHSSVNIEDDKPNDIPFNKGILSFAGSKKNSRNSQIFITLGRYVTHLGNKPWEVPFARVLPKWLDNLDFIETKYGDKVSQKEIWAQGYQYLYDEFPDLSYMNHCRVVANLPHIQEVKEKRAQQKMKEELKAKKKAKKEQEAEAKKDEL